MLPYWIFFAIFAAGAINHRLTADGRPQRMIGLTVAVIAAIFFIGLRYDVGTDWPNYQIIYEVVSREPFGSTGGFGDPAYTFLNGLAYQLGFGIWFVNLICAAIFLSGIAAFARRQPNPWLVLAVSVPYLIIVVGMGYTRQATAIGLIFLALNAFSDRRYVRFALIMGLAVMFHKSAVIAVPLIAISEARNRGLIYLGFAVVGVAFYFLFLNQFIESFFSNYFENEMRSSGTMIRLVINGVPALIFLLLSRRLVRSRQELLLWRGFSLAAIGLFGLYAALPSSTVVDRIGLYLMPLQVIVLSRLPYCFGKGTRGPILAVILIGSALIQLVWLQFADNSRDWHPYRFYPIEDVRR